MRTSFLFKVLVLAVAFGGVIYSIRSLRSPEFERKAMEPDNALAVLIGSDYRPYTWCPKETSKVDIFANSGSIQKSLTAAAEVSTVCELMMGPVSADDAKDTKFVQRMAATGADNTTVILEQIPDKGVFRVKGLSFSSPMLVKALQRHQAP
jgi:hypothetical protein